MQEIHNLMGGFAVALSWFNLMLMLAGIVLGVIIGVLPGLGGANGVAILLPLTFSMAQQPGGATSAIILLSCIYWGALFGGAITSILFNIPGEPWSVATTFDGYPLGQKGRAGAALRSDWEHFTVVPVDDLCLARSREIGCAQRIRTLDAIHIAAAERLPAPARFLTFDLRQHEAAAALGLDVMNVGR